MKKGSSAAEKVTAMATFTRRGEESRQEEEAVINDVRSAAEALSATDQTAAANPIQEIESLCMRCRENVSVSAGPLLCDFVLSLFVRCFFLLMCAIETGWNVAGHNSNPSHSNSTFSRGGCRIPNCPLSPSLFHHQLRFLRER